MFEWKTCEPVGNLINNKLCFTHNFADHQVGLAQDSIWSLRWNNSLVLMQYGGPKKVLKKQSSQLLTLVGSHKCRRFGTTNRMFWVSLSHKWQNRLSQQEITLRMESSKNIVRCMWTLYKGPDTSQLQQTKTGQNGCEVRTMIAELERITKAIERDYLRRSTEISRLERMTNEEIRRRMDVQEAIIDIITKKNLLWFGQLIWMPNERLMTKKIANVEPSEAQEERETSSLFGMKSFGTQWHRVFGKIYWHICE